MTIARHGCRSTTDPRPRARTSPPTSPSTRARPSTRPRRARPRDDLCSPEVPYVINYAKTGATPRWERGHPCPPKRATARLQPSSSFNLESKSLTVFALKRSWRAGMPALPAKKAAYFDDDALLRATPASALTFENFEGLFRPPAPGFVVREVCLVFVRGPLVEDGHDELPSALGHVLARVERRVAEYAVEYQALVGFGEL